MNTSTNEYVYVPFMERLQGNVKERRMGIAVGDHLAVTYTYGYRDRYSVYSRLTGKMVVKASFSNKDECIRFAGWLNQIYGDYFDLWEVYPDWDIVVLTQYTVARGLTHKKALKALEDLSKQRPVNLGDLNRVWYEQ